MKRALALILSLVMVLTLLGCGDYGSKSTEPSEPVGGDPIEITKSTGGNPLNGFDAEGNLAYGGDPSVLVDGDTVYLYVGHDTALDESYVIPEYLCYSSKDLVNWTYEGVMLRMSDVSWADNNSAWAGQVAKHYDEASGKDMYYLYYCSWNNKDSGKQGIGVAVSESPTGPFVDIGAPVVAGSVTTDETSAWNDIDPTVWIETDEKGVEHRYLCWGNSKLYMCELNEDMISVKDYNGDGQITFGTDIISHVNPSAYTEGPWLYRRQDENGNYYGVYYVFYASSWRERLAYSYNEDGLMEGYWYYGNMLMQPTATSNTNHPAVFDFNGKTYMIYHNGSLPGGSGFRRVACIAELEFDEDGEISYVEESAIGLAGTASTITNLNGESLSHAHFDNSSSDDAYPYDDIAVGSGLSTDALDAQWEIIPGLHDSENAYYVTLESVNKPGLFICASEVSTVLSHCYSTVLTDVMTFKTVTGLAGEGVSFESIVYEGMYLTLSGGSLSLTDGSDAASCSFIIQEVTE